MDLHKLEKLSCLHIEEPHRPYFQKSMDDVFHMMTVIQSLPLPASMPASKRLTTFSTVTSECLSKTSDRQDLPMEDGLFLAPKVIKKD